MISIKEIKKAPEIIENALNDKDFLEWVEDNKEDLNEGYDVEMMNCSDSLEEPEGYNLYCLYRYLESRSILVIL